MTFTVGRHHNIDVCHSTNRCDPRRSCPLNLLFVWKGALARERYGKGNTKADLMVQKLIEWCEKEVTFLTADLFAQGKKCFHVAPMPANVSSGDIFQPVLPYAIDTPEPDPIVSSHIR
jgi:hypothetical protein